MSDDIIRNGVASPNEPPSDPLTTDVEKTYQWIQIDAFGGVKKNGKLFPEKIDKKSERSYERTSERTGEKVAAKTTDKASSELLELFSRLHITEAGYLGTQIESVDYVVEAYDEPLVAQLVTRDSLDLSWKIELQAGLQFNFELESLRLDEWDRFHGYTQKPHRIPFVLSDLAQNDFFDLLDSYEDDSITIDGKTIKIPPYWAPQSEVDAEAYWTKIYKTEQPRWDLGQPAPGLVDMLNKIKLGPSRIIVLGGGKGHDGAHMARLGHMVTLVDISEEAIAGAREKYGHISNLKFVVADIFNLPREFRRSFDIVVEHTCYCAINPVRRNQLVSVWRSLLAERGYLLGVFFAMDRFTAPPFGGTEWELNQRLKKYFRTLHWNRLRNSIDRRNGKEFVVFMEILSDDHESGFRK